ncbi:MAG: hypothetical protein CMH34_09835 [Microbacterium sp.]|nr:hypothetical protein [Microbacterium sp.]
MENRSDALRARGRFASDEGTHAQFIELDARGLSAAEIADIMHVDPRTVTRWRHAAGRSKAPAAVRRDGDVRARALALLDEGASFAEAARTVGVCRSTIARWFPDRRAWTRMEAGRWSAQIRDLNEAVLHG